MVHYLLLLLPSLSLLTGALQVPCNSAPEHGSVRISGEGIHEFSCDDTAVHELMGRQTARCLPDGYLDIASLPKCVVKQPLTTHIKSTHRGVLCTNAAAETRHDLIMKYLSSAQCIREKTCIFKEMKFDCPFLNKVTIEQVFVVLNSLAERELKDLASTLAENRHTRQKRQFDDADTEDVQTADCATGQGVSSSGDNCVDCPEGMYSNGENKKPKCLECAVGTYNPTPKQTVCKTCESPKSTLLSASTKETDCQILCTLPATSINSQFTVAGVAQNDGSNVALNTKFTLLCNQGYTFKNTNMFDTTCVAELKTTDIKNECFKVTTEPNMGVYNWEGASAKITCVGNSNVNPFKVEIRKPLPTGVSAEFVEGTDSYDATNKVEKPQFTVSATAPGRYELSCNMQVYSDIADVEKSTDSTAAVFFKTLPPASDINKNVGEAFTIAVMVYKDASSKYAFSWTKDSKAYNTFQNSDKTVTEVEYKTSEVSIDKVTLDDPGKYECTVAISDLAGNEKLTKKFATNLAIKGFSVMPQTADGGKTLTQSTGSAARLTCAFKGGIDASESLVWTLENNNNDVSSESYLSYEEETKADGSKYKYLKISAWPSTWSNTKFVCRITNTADNSAVFTSDPITLTSSTYTVTMDTEEKCTEGGKDVKFTCVASFPDSITNGPSITWHKVDGSGDKVVTQLLDGDKYVVVGAKDGTNFKSTLTVDKATQSEAGSYYCVATYTEPSYLQISKKTDAKALTVVEMADIAKKQVIIGATDVVFSTTFNGAQPLAAKWVDDNNNEINTAGNYEVVKDITADKGPYTLSLKVKKVEADTPTSFKVKVNLKPPCNSVFTSNEYVKTAELQKLTTQISTDAKQFQEKNDYVFAGTEVKFTCSYTNPKDLAAPTVTWTATATKANVGTINDYTTDTTSAGSFDTGKVVITIAKAEVDKHSGSYKCAAAYPNSIGTAESETRILHVLGFKPIKTVFVAEGGAKKIQCTFLGRDGTVTWKKSGSETNLSSKVTSEAYNANGEKVSSLAFTAASQADEGQYSCTMKYNDIDETKVLQPWLKIMRITEVTATPAYLDVGSKIDLSCKISWDIADLSYVPVVRWKLTGTDSTEKSLTLQSDKYKYSVATAAAADMGVYTCEVDFKDDNAGKTLSKTATVYVRTTPVFSIKVAPASNFHSPSTVLMGVPITLSCVFSGDAIGDVSWYRKNVILTDTDVYELPAATVSAYGAVSTATIKQAKITDETYEGEYKCKANYKHDNKEAESNVLTLSILGATGVISSKQYSNKGDQVVFTCNYLENTGDNKPATWVVPGISSPTSSSDSATQSQLTIGTAAVENNGLVKCKVTYAGASSLTNEVQIEQFVRDTVFQNIIGGKVYGLKGQQAILTCVMHGDKLKAAVTWDKAELGKAATETYANSATKSTFTIASVKESDGVAHKCSGAYAHDDAKAEATQTLTVLKATVTGTATVNKGADVTLTCDPTEEALSYSWKKGANPIANEVKNTLALTAVDFTAAAEDYKCVVVYKHSLGTLESDAFRLFVQGFVDLIQINKAGAHNEAGETITLKATIRSEAEPAGFKLKKGAADDTFSKTGKPTKKAQTANDWEVELEFAATKVDGANKKVTYKVIADDTGDIESTIELEIFEKCPVENIADIAKLDGTPLDHEQEITGLECGGGKTLFGSTSVKCNDGTVTWGQPQNEKPECVALAVKTHPVDQLVEDKKETTMSCTSIDTPVTVTKVEWFTSAGVQYTDSSPTATEVSSGIKSFTSNYKITGAENLNKVAYQCRMTADNGKSVESNSAKVYIVGIKSLDPVFPGKYFESDGQGGDFSEAASIKLEAYVGSGITSQAGKFVVTGTATDIAVTFSGEAEANNVKPYTYTIAEDNKKTGTYTVTIVYTKPANANGVDTYTKELKLPVYQFCKVSALPAVDGGTWSPAQKVEHRGFATFSCGDGKWMMGDSKVQCLMGAETSQFEEFVKPSCKADSELTCGRLSKNSPANGHIVYESAVSAYFVCDAGYTLINAQPKYTCTENNWSIKTKDNPMGLPPICQAAEAAKARVVTVSDMKITVSAELCQDATSEGKVNAALLKALEDANLVQCTKNHKCSLGGFTCSHAVVDTKNTLTVGFTLTQTYALADKLIMTEDASRINAKANTVTFQVNTAKRKRSTVSATVTGATAATTTTCGAGSALIDNSCSQCPPGYGFGSGTCTPCGLGFYSVGNNINACTQCSNSKTTMNKGTTAASGCISTSDVCTIGASTSNAVFVPPTGSRIPFNEFISVSCGVGKALEYGVEPRFKCGTTDPKCYEVCSLTEFTSDSLKEKFIHDEDLAKKEQMREGESITVTCQSGYEITEDVPVRVYKCTGGKTPVLAACVEESGSQVLTTVIVCVVVLGVAVILLFLFIIVQWRKKKNAASYKMKGDNGFQDPIENMAAAEEGTGVQMKKVSLKLSEADKKAPLMSRPVHISDFSKYYDLLTRNDDRELKQEFSTFDSFDDNNTCYHGSIPENDSKNRYKNIIPFDHSRVKLSIINDDVHSDYINASYIHGYHKPRVFIATQAPLYETLDDFWRMVWEKKSTMLVNLTKVEENGKIKSIVYWPSVEERAKQFGLVNVKRLDKQESEFFVVYTFEITHKAEEGVREVFMFNYVGWPDFDVPTRTTEFVNFIYNIRHLLFIRPPMGPIICHCSAGTGRTGAYIGIMNSLDRLINKEDLDILGLVGSLRQQRRKMVFTNTQYKFLHRVMMDIVTNDNFDLLKQSGFRKKIDVQGVVENPYVSTSESDELDELNDTKV